MAFRVPLPRYAPAGSATVGLCRGPMLLREVKLWYYHRPFTYNTSRKPMIGHFQPCLIGVIKAGWARSS
jgi:hypothetical protein